MTAPQYLINSESRTFIREYGESFSKYDYYACTIADALSQDNGEVSSNYYPDFKYDMRFVESATIVGFGTRPTMSIVGRIPRNFNSKLYQLANSKKSANFQLHFGRCYNPTTFNTFDEAVILEDVRIVNYNTDRLGSLGRDESAIINETVSVSVGHWYTIHKLAFKNIGLQIIEDGYLPMSMDILECDDCFDSGKYCKIFVLVRADFDPAFTPYRIYMTEDNGINWRYVEIPESFYEQTITAVEYSTISVFEDYVYLHLKTDVDPSAESRIFSMPTADMLRGDGIWTLNAVNGGTENIYASDRIIKFKNNFYAPYVEDIAEDSSEFSRVVNFGGLVGANYSISYVPVTNSVLGIGTYHDTPLYLYNYKDQILFSGIYIGHQDGSDPKNLYIAYTKDGYKWIEVPIIVDGQQQTVTQSVHIHIAPLTDKQWLVTIQRESGENIAYYTVNGGKTWKSIAPAFRGVGFLATYIPTESIVFSDKYRSYDGGVTAIPLPDKLSEATYSTDVGGIGVLGNTYGRAFGCRNNPNEMFTYGNDGIFMFS